MSCVEQYTYIKQEAVVVLKNIMERHKVERLLVFRGKKSFVECGGGELVRELFETHNMEIRDFYDFSANPKKEDVDKGVELIHQYLPDAILAIGGGSVIDMAKLCRFYSNRKQIPLIAISTTAGTGAEVTRFAVCYKDGVKLSIEDDAIQADYAVLVPELTMKNGTYLTACSGFDALAQAIEAYWNIYAGDVSDAYAMKAIELLFPTLPALEGNLEWRSKMLLGAYYAGMAINITHTTAPHALSYVLTSKYNYPHGHAVALTFPYFFEKNVHCVEKEYADADYVEYNAKMHKLLKVLGWKWEDDLYARMKDYVGRLELGYDSKRPFESEVVEKGVNLQRAQNNPMQLNEQIIKEAVASIIK